MSTRMTTPALPQSRPTMVDVARLAGVSVKTVSRVVNGEPGVREATSRRVEEAIDRVGFLRNDGASQLRSGRTNSIGLVVEDLGDPFYSALARAVERVSRQHGHLMISGSGEGSANQERSLTGALLSRRVSGLLLVPTASDHSWLSTAVADGTPVVALDRPAAGLRADTVLTDNEGGVRSAVEHLAAHGHRHIGFLGDNPEHWTAGRRLAGFEIATGDLGLRSDTVASGPYERDELEGILTRWTSGDDAVTAVLTGNNRVTVTVLRALRATRLGVSMVGFDDFELADVVHPAVTVVAQDPAAMGEQAAQLLFRRLAGDTSPPRSVVLLTRLVVRESGRGSPV